MLSVLTGQKQAQRRALYFIITGLAGRDKAFGAISHSAKGGRGWYILRATPTASWTASKTGSCAGQVDYVLTHDAPSKFLDFSVLAEGENNRLHLFLDKVVMKTTYEKWFFGCHHKDVQLSTKSRCLFCDVVSIGEKKPRWKRR